MKKQEKSQMVFSGIPVSEVSTMVHTYHDYCRKHPDYKKHPHVKSVWFPIQAITDMYNGLLREKADGLRIYLGRYPDDITDFDDPKPAPNTNSVVFVSTYNDNGEHIDYFTDSHPMVPVNRGEQCQPNCNGVKIDTPN